jgi:CHAD domain-containing protein
VNAAPFFTRKLRALDRVLSATLPRVTKSADDEAIHDFRVAMRRTRTLLKLGRPLFGRFHADAVRSAFAEVMRATGALRDEEVLEETLRDLQLADPELDKWLERRGARERSLRRAVLARIERGEVASARGMLKALLTLPVNPKRDRDLVRFCSRCVERARARVEAKKNVDVNDVTGMHDLRIAYKELRYAAELLAEGLPIELAQLAEGAARFQKRLGVIHDVDVALETIERTRALSHESRDRILAALRDRRAREVAKYQSEGGPPSEEQLLFI